MGEAVRPRGGTQVHQADQATILITGGAGFIGTALAKHLAANGHHIVAVDSLHPQVHAEQVWPADYPANAETITADVTDPQTWDKVFTLVRPSAIVHLAAETGTGQSLSQASRHGRVNVVGTTEMLDGLTRHGHLPETITLTSSRAVYGEGRWAGEDGHPFYAPVRGTARLQAGLWEPEAPPTVQGPIHPLAHRGRDTEPRPANVYAATKLAQENILSSWCAAMGCALSILRLQNVYGPGQSLTNPYTGIVSFFAQLGLRREAIDVYEGGRIVRDFVFIDDVVAALSATIERRAGTPFPIDIGSGQPVTLLELAEIIARQTSAPSPAVSDRFRPGDVRAAFADLSSAREVLDYEPQVDVVTGLSRLLEWIRTL